MPVAGDTFLQIVGSAPSPHLWAVLWGPAGAADAYLVVMFVTLRAHSDRTCILRSGDHPFIRHDTAVEYRQVARWTDERIQVGLARGLLKPRAPFDEPVLERIRAGFFTSAHTPNALKEMVVRDFGVDPARYNLP